MQYLFARPNGRRMLMSERSPELGVLLPASWRLWLKDRDTNKEEEENDEEEEEVEGNEEEQEE